jgi:hypothetical protein
VIAVIAILAAMLLPALAAPVGDHAGQQGRSSGSRLARSRAGCSRDLRVPLSRGWRPFLGAALLRRKRAGIGSRGTLHNGSVRTKRVYGG